MIELMHGDCLELMKDVPDQSVDMILCDLPYGTTACKWDTVIPFEPLWAHYKRVIKPNGAIVLFGSQPFTTALIASNMKDFRYCWVWEKSRPVGFLQANRQPMRKHEDVAVFSASAHSYNPQGLVDCERKVSRSTVGENYRPAKSNNYIQKKTNYPVTVLKIGSEGFTQHPTQKPVALMEYLIRTYTNEGETVMDNCMGSGTTGVACVNTGRKFIGMEQDAKYFEIAQKRIHDSIDLPDWLK